MRGRDSSTRGWLKAQETAKGFEIINLLIIKPWAGMKSLLAVGIEREAKGKQEDGVRKTERIRGEEKKGTRRDVRKQAATWERAEAAGAARSTCPEMEAEAAEWERETESGQLTAQARPGTHHRGEGRSQRLHVASARPARNGFSR